MRDVDQVGDLRLLSGTSVDTHLIAPFGTALCVPAPLLVVWPVVWLVMLPVCFRRGLCGDSSLPGPLSAVHRDLN
ncbi:hypothetical protein GCM10023317_84510 [Actinopolymorpha pittospori]